MFNAFQKNKLNEIIYEYNENGPMKELEIRFVVGEDKFRDIYSSLLKQIKTGKIEQSISVVVPRTNKDRDVFEQNRREIFFEKGVKKAEHWLRKKQLKYLKVSKGSLMYKIAVSSEETSEKFAINSAKVIRLKLRSSIILPDYKDWRFDLWK